MRLDKRRCAVAVLVPTGALLGLSALAWVRGEARDVLSHGATEVSGGAAAAGIPGLAAVCAVALLALMTGGRVIRAVASVALVLASVGAALLTLLAVLRPDAVVAAAVARELARTTAPGATGTTTVWAWLAVVVSLALVAGSVVTVLSARSWSGLSARYERGDRPASGPRGEVRTDWDVLSEGGDPTVPEAAPEAASEAAPDASADAAPGTTPDDGPRRT